MSCAPFPSTAETLADSREKCFHPLIGVIAAGDLTSGAGASIPWGGCALPFAALTAMTRFKPVDSAERGGESSLRALDGERLPQHLDRLYRAAVVMTGSRHEAEDLVQETCVRVLRRPRLLRNDDDLAYLMRAMRNAWLNLKRRRGNEAQALQQSAALLEGRAEPDPLLNVEVQALLTAVAELPPIYRDVIAAVDVAGLSYKEAARALKTREGTVMSRLFRARVQVGEALQA
jgi:RNA polymerase sigma-70 factor, ECF subfamily